MRTSRPAAATMATASDTCRTTSARRIRRPGPPSEPRPPLRSGAATSPLASSQAGMRPATAVARPMPTVTVATTTPSMPMASTRGSPSGRLATSARKVHQANATPTTPAVTVRSHALGQNVRDDPAARCAERGPHRELLPAALATQQYEIGHIGARDQQHEADRHHQRDDERLHVADDRGREWKHDRYEPAGIPRRRRPLELGGHRRQLASRLFERHAGAKSPDQIDLAARGIAKWPGRRRRMGRAPQLDTLRKVEVRHDADNRESLLLDLDATPQHERRCRRSDAARTRG